MSARQDRGHAGAHRAFADFELSLALDQGRESDFDSGDIGDRVEFSRGAIERNAERTCTDGWCFRRSGLRFTG